MSKGNFKSISLLKLDEKVVSKIFATLIQYWKDYSFIMTNLALFKYAWFVEHMEINKCDSVH